MMTQQLGFSVLSAPIAALDRRSLSQAWYSALHLAHDAPRSASVPPPPVESRVAAAFARPLCSGQRSRKAPAPPQPLLIHAKRQTPRANAPAIERRLPRSPLARKIEYALLHPASREKRTTFTVDGTNARVHVSLLSTPRGMRLIAVCVPRLRAAVARALEEARYALAARGIAVEARVAE